MANYRNGLAVILGVLFAFALGPVALADDVEVLGVTFPQEKVVSGKTLKLNGVSYRKAMGLIKVYVVGLYLEQPTQSGEEVIRSEQIKHLHFHYLTDKATAEKLQEGFIAAMTKCNPPELMTKHAQRVTQYRSWLDKDMAPGLTSTSTYVPGEGLTLVNQGQVKGTIADPEFAQMYYRYNFGEKANAKIRDGLLGL
ncbi:MAG: chalcone isomerase family protein [Desulfosarcinaceae bacterium]|nr:chalcone isomerase family protein [Desulfosarcinaceae bacterium]